MRKYLYTILLLVTGILIVVIIVFSKDPTKVPHVLSLKERVGSTLSSEWLDSKKVVEGLVTSIELNPKDNVSKLKLAQIYIQEARVTGDHLYYDKAAIELFDEVISVEPKNFDALCGKATVLLSQHHFSEGLAIANEALPINPQSAFVYGLMCDANVELGNYDAAVKMADKMVSVRPDARSYSRISYLREIMGDYKGAIEAAKLAVSAGYPGLEQTAWTRMILAHLYENTGGIDTAEYQYRTALLERPDYPFAIAGLGRLEKIKGNYKEAISYFQKAQKLIIEYSFADELTDLYLLNNEIGKSKKSAQEVIDMLSPISNSDESSSAHGHYADKELAHAYLKIPDTENALKHAMLEYERRPDNIDVCEVVAWVHYKMGNFEEAKKFIDSALRTNSKNPSLLCRAGLIKIKAGEKETGRGLIKTAFETNPFMEDIFLKKEASSYLVIK